jgi:hypothetical protein
MFCGGGGVPVLHVLIKKKTGYFFYDMVVTVLIKLTAYTKFPKKTAQLPFFFTGVTTYTRTEMDIKSRMFPREYYELLTNVPEK